LKTVAATDDTGFVLSKVSAGPLPELIPSKINIIRN